MSSARNTAPGDAGPGGWSFGLAGFAVSVPWNALLGMGLIALLWYPEFSSARTVAGQWALAGVFAVLLMASILVHELAHGIVARAFGYPVTGITLWAMGGYTTFRTGARHGPAREAAIALAGPVATLAIAALALLGARAAPPGVLADVLAAVAWANALVGFFNLLPGSPLDGGAVVQAAVWGVTGSEVKGRIVAGWVGRVLAGLVLVAPFLLSWGTGRPPSLIFILVAVMLAALLWSGATNTLRSGEARDGLKAVPALQLALPVVRVSSGADVTAALSLLRPDAHLVVVDAGSRDVAVVTPEAAQAVPPGRRSLGVLTVAARLDRVPTVPAGATALDVLHAVQDTRARFVRVSGADALIDSDAVFTVSGS